MCMGQRGLVLDLHFVGLGYICFELLISARLLHGLILHIIGASEVIIIAVRAIILARIR